MQFKRRFGEQKRKKPTKGLFLVVLLVIVVLLWYNAEGILSKFFLIY